jgi:two-component system sensor histidine kinase YesM
LFQVIDGKSGTEFTHNIQGDKKLILYQNMNNYPWVIVKGVSYGSLQKTFVSMLRVNLLVQAGFTVLGAGLALLLSLWLYRPLYNLVRGINQVKQGNLAFELKAGGSREMASITTSFNQMTKQLHHMIEIEYTMRINLQQAQLKALEAQINPHFLYNTFQVIGSIALEKNVEEIHDITYSLAKVCRYSIRPDTGLVRLKDEIDHLTHYIKIQGVRFIDQLHTTIEISDSVWDVQIPKLTLQPLVENAIEHGFHNKTDVWHIDISARENDSSVLIEIRDNGAGIREEDLVDIQKRLQNTGQNVFLHEHIGLANIKERLLLHFNEYSDLSISSKPGEGTWVQIRIPLSKGEEHL